MSLTDRALRNLFVHSAVHLDVEWRDLGEGQWNARVECQSDVPLRRARSFWTRAVHLRGRGRMADLPNGLLEAMQSYAETSEDVYRGEGHSYYGLTSGP